jgi:hypothetical protein
MLSMLSIADFASATSAREWFVLRLGEHQIGYIERSREVVGAEVHSREYFRARFNRNGVPLTVTTEEKHRELADGTPLQFSYRQKLGESEMRMSGTLLDRQQIRLRVRYGGASVQRRVSWPEGALLMEGVRQRERAMGHSPGSVVRYRAFNLASLEGVDTEARVVGPETIQLGTHQVASSRVEHVLALAQTEVRVVAHVDQNGHLLRTTLPLFGRELLIERADQRQALLPQARTDIYDFTLVAAPGPIDAALRRQDLRYQVRFARDDDGRGLPVAGQEWQARGRGRFDLVVRAAEPAPPRAPQAPTLDLTSTTWINADDHAIRRFAERATLGAKDGQERASRLERAVRMRIANKSLRVGYASASEAFSRREGDCTEHALLLAAAARSIGIPARVAIGLVYADRFGSRERVFVPHAWTQAWIDGRWLGLDAALNGYGSDHIALATSDGDPSDYYASLERIGGMFIDDIRLASAPR